MDKSAAIDLLLQGQTHLQQGRFADAERLCRQVAEAGPQNAAAHQLLGLACLQLGRREEAISAMRRSVALAPTAAAYFSNLGAACCAAGDYKSGVEYHRRSVDLNPAEPTFLANLGDALRWDGQNEQAIETCRRAIELAPDCAEAWNNLGAAQRVMGKSDDAVESLREAVRRRPDLAAAWTNLRSVLMHCGSTEEVIEACRSSLGSCPDQASIQSDLLMSLLYQESPREPEIYREHLQWNQYVSLSASSGVPSRSADHSPDRRLRIGYVSPDFRQHSVAYFIEPVLTAHDRQRFEVLCYSNNSREDQTTRRLRGMADHWHDITRLSDEAAAELIRSHGVDILVDLAGHTAGNRLGIFARRVAPVQVSYLGYPATTGLDAMDYRLTTELADPPGMTENFHSEELVRLPETFLCYRPPPESPEVAPPPCLQAGQITFGCFNQFAKINADVIDAWAQILKALPASRLLIKAQSLEDEGVRRRLLERLRQRGIDRNRVELRPRDDSFQDHMATYNRVDIALDTFPYNGTTTTFEAMWMGVPIVSMVGNVHRGRVGLTILSAAGLPELAAASPEDYAPVAVRLAKDQGRLTQLRQTLRTRLQESKLMDGPWFTRNLEDAYRQMWARWCRR